MSFQRNCRQVSVSRYLFISNLVLILVACGKKCPEPALDTSRLDQIKKNSSEIIVEAISRMRSGNVIREAGYDGEFGVIKLFKPNELKSKSTSLLFEMEVSGVKNKKEEKKKSRKRIPLDEQGFPVSSALS